MANDLYAEFGPDEEPIPITEIDPKTGYPRGYGPPGGLDTIPANPVVQGLKTSNNDASQIAQASFQQQYAAPQPQPQPQPEYAAQPQPIPPQPTYAPRPDPIPVQPAYQPPKDLIGLNNFIPQAVVEYFRNGGEGELPASETYPVGLNQNMVDNWKARYGEVDIYSVIHLDRVWVFRTYPRAEFSKLVQAGLSQEVFEEQVCMNTVLWPNMTLDQLRALPAGIAKSLHDYVLYYSGFNAVAQPVRL